MQISKDNADLSSNWCSSWSVFQIVVIMCVSFFGHTFKRPLSTQRSLNTGKMATSRGEYKKEMKPVEKKVRRKYRNYPNEKFALEKV